MHLKISLLSFIFLITSSFIALSQTSKIRIEPPNWWVGMRNSEVQLMIYGEKIASMKAEIDCPGVEILKEETQQNPNYKFITLYIDIETRPGIYTIQIKEGGKVKFKIPYEFKQREFTFEDRKSFGNEDIIYLLMPDRFSNGDPKNDSIKGMPDKVNRADKDARHGGDIKGIMNHLDYFNKLGVTAIWINPLLENNMKAYSYHGYAATDLYKIDARFGSNQDYRNLADSMHSHNLKLIMDMVFNHVGSEHWMIKDLPNPDWIHQFPEFTQSNYRAESISDPYASQYDKTKMSDGWFDRNMPDLNQKNPFLAKYLTQNSIWWIEYAGLDGIRMDTWPYPDQKFMADWAQSIKNEYPNFNILAETWLQTENHTAMFQTPHLQDKNLVGGIDNLTDFPSAYAINQAFNEKDGWTTGLSRFYYVLSHDFVYPKPNELVTFADNHDIARIYSTQGKDLKKWKMAMTYLLTTRGIPQIYYGTEYLSEGLKEDGDGNLRKDFPGGWKGDSVNIFTQQGMTNDQKEAFEYLQFLIQLRKENSCFQTGGLVHYVPQDGIYVYFRFTENQNFMVIFNNNSESKTIEANRFKESLGKSTIGENVFTHEKVDVLKGISIPAKSSIILKIKN